uniref:Gypsy retrotransposon integrase-like protein 1 n=1 Tax=Leptobrachium leishanense TaxID=445787 RepID=A0A8C5P6V7_9ANUR
MELADVVGALDTLSQQVNNLTCSVRELQSGQRHLQEQFLTFQTNLPTSPSEGFHVPEPRIPMPERYSGRQDHFQAFVTSCELLYSLNPRTYSSDYVKIRTTISLLTGEAQAWAHNLLRSQSPVTETWSLFLNTMAAMFDDPLRASTAENGLRSLRQGRRSVEAYVIDFRRLACETGWNDAALIGQFRLGLSEALKDEIARVGAPSSLENLVQTAIQIDRRLRERARERSASYVPTPRPQAVSSGNQAVPPTLEEPMQVGFIQGRLPPDELHRRRLHNLCLYCGRPNHIARYCPEKTKGRTGNPSPLLRFVHLSTSSSCSPLLTLPLVLQWGKKTRTLTAMVDSGASGNFLDKAIADTVCIPVIKKPFPLQIQVVDGSSLSSGPVIKETVPLQVTIGSGHSEVLQFDIVNTPLFPVILGLPWLRQHDPRISWASGMFAFTSSYCIQHCLSSHHHVVNSVLDTNMTPQYHTVLPEAYSSFSDVFDEKGVGVLPPRRPYDCPIELLPGAPIPYGRLYPLSELELKVLKGYIQENLDKGFIRHSTSPAGAGIFFVEKKDGGLRPCVDYRELNRITIKNRYPLPLISELIERLQGATVYTKIDLKGAYNLVRVRQGDEWKTAFRSRYGHFEYMVMPFGLCNAPGTFQHFLNDIFRDLLDQYVVIYLDDILVFSCSLTDHRGHVATVLSRLRTYRLYAKIEKCVFEATEIEFLGFLLTPGRIAMDHRKVAAIHTWPMPNDKKTVQRFIGFANFYRRFIQGFSSIILPLTALTKQQTKFNWTAEAQHAFDSLKHCFSTAPVLVLPDPSQPYEVEVDASSIGIGAVLSQRRPPERTLHPVAFYSRKLTPAEVNYDVSDRELLAIKCALAEWRHLLEGALHPFMVFTDHKNLEYLKTAKRLNPRQARWSLFFSRFDFQVTYKPGTQNKKADALSRLSSPTVPPSIDESILPSSRFLGVTTTLMQQIRTHTGPTDPAQATGPQTRHKQCLVPLQEQLAVLQQFHDTPGSGHPGIRKTKELITRYFWWPTLAQDVKKFVNSCSVCARAKHSTKRPVGLLQPLPVPEQPWSHITIDFIVELPPSHKYTTIMVTVDRLTKMAHFTPVRGLPTAAHTASLFLQNVYRLHGVPESIVSDRGVQFTSRFWKHFCRALGISVDLSTAHHPHTNGQTERVNQTLETYLRCYTTYLQDDWDTLLGTAEYAYNARLHDSTRCSPFFMLYGYHPPPLPGLPSVTPVPGVASRLRALRLCRRTARDCLITAQSVYKAYADRRRSASITYSVGQRVWLSTRHLRLLCPSRKLGPKYIGPFSIVSLIGPVAVRLRLPSRYRFHPVVHVSLLKPVGTDVFVGRSLPPPPPVSTDGSDAFEVAQILDSRLRRGVLQYLVDWVGYDPEERSWEPATYVRAPALVRAFHAAHPGRPGPLRVRRPRLRGGVMLGLRAPRRLLRPLPPFRARARRGRLGPRGPLGGSSGPDSPSVVAPGSRGVGGSGPGSPAVVLRRSPRLQARSGP